jgi:hypothetical protein
MSTNTASIRQPFDPAEKFLARNTAPERTIINSQAENRRKTRKMHSRSLFLRF